MCKGCDGVERETEVGRMERRGGSVLLQKRLPGKGCVCVSEGVCIRTGYVPERKCVSDRVWMFVKVCVFMKGLGLLCLRKFLSNIDEACVREKGHV